MLWMKRSTSRTSHPRLASALIGTVRSSHFFLSEEYVIQDGADWAYLEDWCRRLTHNFQDVYVFTVPLYLPKQDPDGKWRIVSYFILL